MKLGIKAKIYRNVGTYNAPNWQVINQISDLKVGASWDKADASTRASRIKKGAKTLLGLEVTGKVRVSNTDAGYIALWNAVHSDDTLDLLVLNGAIDENGSRGYRANWQAMSGDEDQGLPNVLFMDFMLEPSIDEDNEPKKVVITGGSPVYTDVAA